MKSILSVIALAFFISGCSDSNNKDQELRTGHLFFSGIEGLSYDSGEGVAAVGEDGSFSYHNGDTVSFWVGNIPLIENIPAKEFLTPLDFSADARQRLQNGDVVNGFSTHTVAEEEVASYALPNNIARFLQLLDISRTNDSEKGRPILILEEWVEQLNENLIEPIDFSATIESFEEYEGPLEFVLGECLPEPQEDEVWGENNSAVNVLLGKICFYGEDSDFCTAPPTRNEINCAISKNKDDGSLIEDYDESLEDYYREDLQSKREQILASTVSTETKESDNAKEMLIFEANFISNELGARLFFDQFSDTPNEGDDATRTLNIYSEDESFNIEAIEIASLNEQIVKVDGFSTTNKTFSYTPVGVAGEETTIIINIKVEGDYRWYKKNFRVVIQ